MITCVGFKLARIGKRLYALLLRVKIPVLSIDP